MTKTEIISTVHKCVRTYETNLCNTQVLFVYLNSKNQIDFAEVRFRSHNFLHFTGLSPREGITANKFYHLILNSKLSPNDFTIRNPINTERKLKILSKIVIIDQVARMLGDYIGPRLELYTEKIIGTTSACLGLIFKNNYFIPNTILHEDIRDITQPPVEKILVVFKMKSSEHYYTNLIYRKKGVSLTPEIFPPALSSKISPQFWSQLAK